MRWERGHEYRYAGYLISATSSETHSHVSLTYECEKDTSDIVIATYQKRIITYACESGGDGTLKT